MQVRLDGCPRRLFLCTNDMNAIYILTLHVDDPIWCYFHLWACFLTILLYMVMNTLDAMLYEIRHYLLSLSLFSWLCGGYGTPHNHWSCSLGKGLWVRVLWYVTIFTLVHTLLLWHYVRVSLVFWSWYVFIWPYIDSIHVDLTLLVMFVLYFTWSCLKEYVIFVLH